MKAGLTAAIFAIQALRNLSIPLAGQVFIESVIGEESGGVGTLTTLVRGWRADAVIIMEPTRLRSCPVHSGALSFRITVTGRAIHASMKRFGVSAVGNSTTYFKLSKSLIAPGIYSIRIRSLNLQTTLLPSVWAPSSPVIGSRQFPKQSSLKDVSGYFPAKRLQPHAPLSLQRWQP